MFPNCFYRGLAYRAAIALALCLAGSFAAEMALRPGSEFRWNGNNFKITKLEALPLIENEYSRLFKFDAASNPKLKELRERHRLEEIIGPGKTEFEKQLLLMNWVHTRFKKFGQPSSPARGALDILSAIEQGHTFFCSQFAHVMVSAASSLGWVNRELALRRHQDAGRGGSTEHSTTEIWSNQFGKWVMLDPTSNMHLERNGVPLNAWEIRQEWFYNDARDLVFVIGKDRQKYRKEDLPVLLAHFPGFGDLAVNPDELDKYGFIGYIPNTDLMDAREDYGNMFIVQDALCAGTKWHKRKNPANPATEPYFPIGQAAPLLTPAQEGLLVEIQTFTPNFAHFESRAGEGRWTRAERQFVWRLRPGTNRLEFRSVNAFGVAGPVSLVEVLSPGE